MECVPMKSKACSLVCGSKVVSTGSVVELVLVTTGRAESGVLSAMGAGWTGGSGVVVMVVVVSASSEEISFDSRDSRLCWRDWSCLASQLTYCTRKQND